MMIKQIKQNNVKLRVDKVQPFLYNWRVSRDRKQKGVKQNIDKLF